MTNEELKAALDNWGMHDLPCLHEKRPANIQDVYESRIKEAARTLLELREKIPGMVLEWHHNSENLKAHEIYNQALTDIQEIIDGN